jgi:hypothetical protein
VIDVPSVGRMQVMKDPQGAAFYLYEPASADRPPEAPAELGEASWHALMTTDSSAAMKFGQILNGPMEVPGGDWIVNAMDPQGAAFALHARKAG